MIRLAIVGGRLQGTEAAFLARQAGYATLLVDKSEQVPARGLCDDFMRADVCDKSEALVKALKSADFVLPATENPAALAGLEALAKQHGLTLAFDSAAYALTASKKVSDGLFHRQRIPAPAVWPEHDGPYIAKPAAESGSKGVRRLAGRAEAGAFLAGCQRPEDWVVQEYLAGRAYSMEVMGVPGHYRSYQATEIHVDEGHDCKRVSCPCPELGLALLEAFSALSIRLAALVGLHGIMDVEVIHSGGRLKVLEIDARLPSQTPTAVWLSTGINFVEQLYRLFCLKERWPQGPAALPAQHPAVYEHLELTRGPAGPVVREVGEGAVAACGPLALYGRHPGPGLVLTDHRPQDPALRATLMAAAGSEAALEEKRRQLRQGLLERLKA